MKFVCDRCQTRYSIADEKVRQKILRIRCKTCGNVIVVQDQHAAPSGGGVGAEGVPRLDHQAAAKTSASSAPKSAPSSAPKASLSSSPKLALGGPPPPPPRIAANVSDPLGGRAEWYLAIAGVRSGPFLRAQAAQMILAAEPGKTVHVWKEGMSGWKPSEEVSVIARELSILRPPAEPPPPPAPPKAASVAPSVGPLKVAAMPAAVAKSAKSPENQPASLFPGKPLTPSPVSNSDPSDFAVENDLGVFADITTKKAKKVQDLASAPDRGSFADATTKKGKNLRDLEAEPPSPSAPASSETRRTPPPVHPLTPVAKKAAEPVPESSSSGILPGPAPASPISLPAAAPALSLNPPGMASPATSSPASSVAPAVPSSPTELGGFDEVIRAMAVSDRAIGTQDFAAPIVPATPPLDAPFPSSDLGIPKGAGRPGLKYVVAAFAIVALVILIVLVTLRMDSRKVMDPEPEPTPAKEPALAEEPKPVAVELPKPEPATVEKPAQQGGRAGSKRSSGKPSHRVDVGPDPERQPTQKQPATPALAARPNPFDESKTVSQSQISSVVRNKTNQAGLRSCYERALKMDNHLTSGRIDVTVSIATSGAVQRVVVNAPASFILVEPCIKNAVKRWVFPPSIEEYATNFPLIMQGGM